MGWLANIRITLITTAAVVLIALAVAFSVLRAVLPHATGYLAEVDQALEQQLGLPVKIASLDADMSWLQPQLKLLSVRVYNADGKSVLVEFDEVSFTLSYLDSLRHMSLKIGGISLTGSDLLLERNKQGRWFLQGIQVAMTDSEQISDELVNQINNTNFSLLDSKLQLRDQTHALIDMDFANVNIQVENLLGTHAVQASLDLPEAYGKSLRFVAEINGDLSKLETANAEVYVDAQSLELRPIFDKLGLEGDITAKGVANTELWLTVESRQIKQIKSRANFSQLEIRSAQGKQVWSADLASANVFWQRYSDAWRLDIVDLEISRNGRVWSQPANLLLRENASAGYQISASYFRLDYIVDLMPLLLATRYPEEVTKVATLNHLQGDVYNLHMTLPPEDKTTGASVTPELRAVFHDLGFGLTRDNISLTGLDGQLEYKDNQVSVLLASNNMVAELPQLFRQPLDIQSLGAAIVVDWDQDHIRVSSDSVQLSNADITTRSRFYARWPENGQLYLDMQTDFRDAVGTAVAKYYPAGIMSDGLVSWLEKALHGGRVDQGSFVFKGKADDFPFADNQGVMEVEFQASDMSLKFLPDWPALDRMAARVRFYNQSLEIDRANAYVYRGVLNDARASIANLNAIHLTIDGIITAPADDVQKYIWNSGLNPVLGDAMRQLQLVGDVDIDLSLGIPLDEEAATVETSGRVRFHNNVLELPAVHYLFTDLSGELAFTSHAIVAEALQANFAGAPVSISANTVYSPRHESVFQVNGRLPIDHLLKDFAWIPDSWLSGESDWDVSIHVPLETNEQLRLSLASSLQGVSVSISDKLSKTADESIPTQIDIKLIDAALQLEINSQDVLALLAERNTSQRWKLKISAPWLQGVVGFDEGLALDSVIDMRFEYADLYSLVKTKAELNNMPGPKPATIPALNFHADILDWDAKTFTDVDMNSTHHSHGMQIKNISVHSPAMSITGKGNWLSSEQQANETNLKLKVRSQHLGDALSGLGYPGTFDRGELEASIDWQWLAQPYRFSLDAVTGVASFKLEKGVILEIKPGAGGRLLGLLNVLQLPQRLRLDFADVYKEGFVFDTIVGDLAFSAGDASTRNVKIEAASANISIDGRVGLVAEDYDLSMEVRPNSAAAAFTGGTLAGGPIVGAGLVLLDKLFGIGKLTQEKYSITGQWNNPVIEQIATVDKTTRPDDNDEN